MPHVKLTAVDLNSDVAKLKKYSNDQIVLETSSCTYMGYKAALQLLAETKYRWLTHLILRPIFIFAYSVISRNRKVIGRFFKNGK